MVSKAITYQQRKLTEALIPKPHRCIVLAIDILASMFENKDIAQLLT